jgi:hypothetical protein
MGIPNHQIIETDKVYDLPGRFEPVRDQVVFITVVGAPDANRLNPGATKKDGSQSYFQNIPQSKTEFETADKHGYVIVEPEHPESIVLGGRRYDVSHGTPTRELWNTIRDNPAQRGEFVTQLYGRADSDLANTLDKIPTGAAPAPEPAKKMKNVKKDLTKVQHDPNAEQPVAEAGNRGYNHGFASPTAPSLGGPRRREDDEYHVPDPVDTSIWYIRANGKIIKDKMGTPFQFRDKEAARKSAMTMMAKPFNAGKKFVLTTQPQDDAPVTESVTHRIGLTVTDPNHPMVSKRGETYHKTVRVTGDDREKAITGAIAHYRRKGYKVHDHHYIGTVDNEPMNELSPKTLGSYAKKAAIDAKFLGHQAGAQQGDAMAHAKRPGDGADAGSDIDDRAHKRLKGVNRAVDKLTGVNEFAPPGGDDGDDGFSDDTLKQLAAQWYNGDEDPRVEKTLMAAGWEIGQDEGYDDEPGVFVVQAGDVNGNSYMSWPADELRQGMAEAEIPSMYSKQVPPGTEHRARYKCPSCGIANKVQDWAANDNECPTCLESLPHGLNQMPLKSQGVAEGLDEAVGGNYLYHATSPAGLKGILQSGYIGAQQTAQAATDAQTKLPSVAVTRDWNYAAGGSRSSEGVGQGAVIVFDRNSIESKYKTFGTSQSSMIKGLPNTTADSPQMKKLAQQLKGKDANKNNKLDYDEVGTGIVGASLKKQFFRPKAGAEAEEAVVVPKGNLPLQGSMMGFWVDPKSELANDPAIMNDPRRLDMIRPNQFVKATQQQGVAEGLNENAEELSVGDPVIISGQGIEFEGKTGDIDSFGDMKRFVVVNLYNHGKHSFHSSDVSYNDYADREDDLDEDLYQYDKEDPYNSEFAPRAGMGRMTLRGWKQQMIRRTAELAQQMAAAGQDIDKSALWDNVHAKLKSMNMDPIAQEIEQAQAELEKIRQRGGVRSRAFNK